MAWWGTSTTDITLGTAFTMGPGSDPAAGYKWLVQLWINGKYIELVRDLDASTNHSLTFSSSDAKGQAIMRGIGNARQATTSKVLAVRYSGGNWADGGQQHQVECRTLPNLTFKIPDNDSYRPNSTLAVSVDNGIGGLYVKGRSRVKINVTPGPRDGTSIREIKTTTSAGEVIYGHEGYTSTLQTTGTFTLTTVVTDERGLSKTLLQSVNVVDYSDPTISTFTAVRCNSSGTAQEEGTYIKISYAYSCKNITGNTGSLTIEKSSDNGSTWSSVTSGSGLSANTNFTTGNILPTTDSLIIRIKVTDKYTTTTKTLTVGPSGALFGIRAKGRAFAVGRQATAADDGKHISALPFTAEEKATMKKDVALEGSNISISTDLLKEIGKLLFPVGSYMWNLYNPSTTLGGTWVECGIAIASTTNDNYVANRYGGQDVDQTNICLYQYDSTEACKWKFKALKGIYYLDAKLWYRDA